MKTKKIETALIVGGGSGMGRAAAAELGRAGIRIFVADLNLAEAKQTAQAILEAKGEAEAFSVDVSSSASVSALFLKLRETRRSSGPPGSYGGDSGPHRSHRGPSR